ncbi:Bug family tripartite tricarboxylate transporter substrate binding protein [Prosthecomicrobium hirschii]|uniref:Bug family tripartite tricarboxylate transporter substrate binding protein n=1 Tax=Prosthecodimorpha hirschii TaxID=665126 RepID=UPI00221F2993|nr:tripartite tricarboxylate transporter substrate binding protein [Prosthecomicrobium hirschii]MCW1839886.1 tripartite tricarboxylate transporter substrate binding protein [Prosthecomicrobium hirschii]
MNRRHALMALAVASLAVTGTAGAASAQSWPTKPVVMVVPFAPGGATDVSARLVAEGLSKELGQSVVVENRTGAAGNIGVAYAVGARPDGYTLLFATMGTLTTNPHLYKETFDVQKDLVPISKTFEVDHVLVVKPSLGVNSIQELVALAKSKPGELTYGSAGIGSSVQMFAVMLNMMAGIDVRQVPYKGSAEARVAVAGGEIDMVMDSPPSALAQIRSGALKALAVTNDKRNETLPDVPTMAEAGITGYAASAWGALLAPAGTPQPIVDRLATATRKVLADPAVIEKYKKTGLGAVSSSPEELRALIAADTKRWGDMVKAAGIKVE